jgi:PAS domain S-box-containing protein
VSKNIRFSLKYTFTGFLAGIFISILVIIIIANSANIFLNTESISHFISEHLIVALLLFIPGIITAVIGYITDLNLNNLLKSKEIEFDELEGLSQQIYDFIEKLRKGESVQKFKSLHENDKIMQSLINLSEEIEKRQEGEEARKKEDAQRAETSEGLAYFGAVLREHNNTIEELAQIVTNELVRYVDAYQAAFYLVDESEEEKTIKEIANYASGRKRFASKELKWGESLPGACIIEKKTNYLKSISDDYIEIESGLGKAKPKSLLLIPVKTQEGIIHGAIELASFKEYEDYEINFMEQVAENTAMTISTLKINNETAILLKESREQAGALTSREDELQKTISEMRRLQENADIQSAAFRAYQDSTNQALIRAEFSNEGKLLFANKKFLKLFEYKSNSEIENEDLSKFVSPEEPDWFDNLKEIIFKKNSHFEGLLKHLTKSGKTIWIESSYIGLRNEKGRTEKILFLGIDATKLKNDVLSLDLKLNQFNKALFTAEFLLSGEMLNLNDRFLTDLNYKRDEIPSKKIYELLSDGTSLNIQNAINQIVETGINYEGEIEFVNSEGDVMYYFGTLFPEKDINDNINSFKISAYDYSQQINFSNKIKEQEELIQEQIKEIEALKERMTRRVENVKQEMRELYIETETAYIFSQKTFELFPDIVISIDKDNKLSFINIAASRFFKTENDIVKGKDIKELLPEIKDKQKGVYLGDVLNIDNPDLPVGVESEVYYKDSEGKVQKFTMLLIKISVGLRQQLTAFLKKR